MSYLEWHTGLTILAFVAGPAWGSKSSSPISHPPILGRLLLCPRSWPGAGRAWGLTLNPLPPQVATLPKIVAKRWPGLGIDVLVNNAGMSRNDGSLFEGSVSSWVEMLSTNVLGTCMCTREVLQVGGGRAVHAGWAGGKSGGPEHISICFNA